MPSLPSRQNCTQSEQASGGREAFFLIAFLERGTQEPPCVSICSRTFQSQEVVSDVLPTSFFLSFFFFLLFLAAPAAYGGSQAGGRI